MPLLLKPAMRLLPPRRPVRVRTLHWHSFPLSGQPPRYIRQRSHRLLIVAFSDERASPSELRKGSLPPHQRVGIPSYPPVFAPCERKTGKQSPEKQHENKPPERPHIIFLRPEGPQNGFTSLNATFLFRLTKGRNCSGSHLDDVPWALAEGLVWQDGRGGRLAMRRVKFELYRPPGRRRPGPDASTRGWSGRPARHEASKI